MIVRVLRSKSPLLCNCILSLNSRSVIGILIKLILLRDAVFLSDHDNGVETRIFSFRYMHVLYQVLNFYSMRSDLTLESDIFVLNCL